MMQRRVRKLGEILLSQGLISESQLAKALQIQQKTGKTLGTILIKTGLVSADDISSVLGQQIHISSRKRLGEVLVDQGLVSPKMLEKGLLHQKKSGKKLGETLIELGYITENKLIDILSAQLDVQHVILDQIKVKKALTSIIPKELCKKYNILPIYEQGGVITIAMADPTNLRTMDHIKFMTGKEIDAVMASEKEIQKAIERVYEDKMKQMSDLLHHAGQGHEELEVVEDEEQMEELTDEEGMEIVKIVNLIIHEAIDEEASDIHMEPTESGYLVKYRVDGELHKKQELPEHMRPQIISRLKIQGGMDIAEKRKPQDGRIKIRHQSRNVDLRVSSFPAMTKKALSEKIVMRIVDTEGKSLGLPQLGLSKDTLTRFERVIKSPDGIMLVTGPTGSGKSMSLYAALEFIKDYYEEKKQIITMEDPVESSVAGITQGQINPRAGFTFAAGMRSILRQDPDIIMIGEMRDLETSQMAVQAALTGHVVFSTLHTNDSPSAYTRLFDMGVAPYLVASTVRGIMAQRLVRRICSNCKEEYYPDDETLEQVGLKPGVKLYRGKGCSKCSGTGMRGRIGLYELLIPDREVQRLVNKKAESEDIKDYLLQKGDFITLRKDGLIKALKGITTLEQVIGATQETEL
ncbi:type IV-A pilus assembly ATPase PilB [Chitinivibrio alkaliphilus ACht1]|uniref:Type IV-A pilus assembly ATPase PilB n=2 Tax=Chitinivibrio TaxID=1505231 RepID=U7D7P8_9BACT|nr:type IV-A pilus assembly ATPase PilB [Chitinivibrio alkaliphilus ACht1]